MSEQRLIGKKALITGSGTGIGHEVALEYARQGADVVVHYAHSDAGAKAAVEEIQAMGRRATAIQASFPDVDSVVALADQAWDFLGGIDYLVNNAGATFNKPFIKVTREQFQTAYDINIRGMYFCTQRVVQRMVENNQGGSIVNMTSVHGVSGAPEHSVYAGTKGAIIAFTRSLAVELAHKGIRVNAVAPGMVVVPNYYKVPGFKLEDAEKGAYDSIPCGFFGLPLDIAKICVFLCTDDARYIIGQTIVADGGTTSLMSLIRDFRTESTASLGTGYIPGI